MPFLELVLYVMLQKVHIEVLGVLLYGGDSGQLTCRGHL